MPRRLRVTARHPHSLAHHAVFPEDFQQHAGVPVRQLYRGLQHVLLSTEAQRQRCGSPLCSTSHAATARTRKNGALDRASMMTTNSSRYSSLGNTRGAGQGLPAGCADQLPHPARTWPPSAPTQPPTGAAQAPPWLAPICKVWDEVRACWCACTSPWASSLRFWILWTESALPPSIEMRSAET